MSVHVSGSRKIPVGSAFHKSCINLRGRISGQPSSVPRLTNDLRGFIVFSAVADFPQFFSIISQFRSRKELSIAAHQSKNSQIVTAAPRGVESILLSVTTQSISYCPALVCIALTASLYYYSADIEVCVSMMAPAESANTLLSSPSHTAMGVGDIRAYTQQRALMFPHASVILPCIAAYWALPPQSLYTKGLPTVHCTGV